MVFVLYKPLVLAGHLVVVMHFLHAGQERETLPCAEEPMTTVECITALFDHVVESMSGAADARRGDRGGASRPDPCSPIPRSRGVAPPSHREF